MSPGERYYARAPAPGSSPPLLSQHIFRILKYSCSHHYARSRSPMRSSPVQARLLLSDRGQRWGFPPKGRGALLLTTSSSCVLVRRDHAKERINQYILLLTPPSFVNVEPTPPLVPFAAHPSIHPSNPGSQAQDTFPGEGVGRVFEGRARTGELVGERDDKREP